MKWDGLEWNRIKVSLHYYIIRLFYNEIEQKINFIVWKNGTECVIIF